MKVLEAVPRLKLVVLMQLPPRARLVQKMKLLEAMMQLKLLMLSQLLELEVLEVVLKTKLELQAFSRRPAPWPPSHCSGRQARG